MTKLKFLLSLHDRLSGLPQAEVEERLAFYSEMIEDRMEDGLSEEDAVAAIGAVDEIAAQIVADIPLSKLVKEKITPKKKLKGWEILLLVLGAPIWFSLLIAVFAVIASLYASLWAMIVSLWAAFASLGACAFSGIVVGIGFAFGEHGLTGIAMIGAGMVCAGLAIFLFFGCKAATTGTLVFTKKIVLWIKNGFLKKEGA